ncbi:MAG TPA: hypothetical protein VK447_19520 [Myxococcaceae bacterium]|nr:hypothetical protein [Myxococcaceae bacterium]
MLPWKDLYRLFDPKQRLQETDDDLYVERPGTVAERIIADLEFEPAGKWVVCGSLGSGKSSELVRLGRQLWKKYTVIALDLPLSVARLDRLTPAEVLFLVGAAAARKASLQGSPVSNSRTEALVQAFSGLISPTARINVSEVLQGVALFISNLAVPGSAPVVGAATGAARLAGGLLGGLTRPVQEGEPALRELSAAVNGILADIRSRLAPPLLLVDGLDKVQEQDSIRGLFATARLLTEPDAPIVYSGPIALMLDTYWNMAGSVFRRERLTNVVVSQPPAQWLDLKEEKIQIGREAMRQLVSRRLNRLSLQVSNVFEPDALEALVTRSGGVLRDLIQLVNRSCRFAFEAARTQEEAKIDSRIAQEAIEELRKEFEVTLNTRRLDELKHVKEKGEPSGKDDVSADLLLNNYVLPYSNGKVWFEPHPILRGARPEL